MAPVTCNTKVSKAAATRGGGGGNSHRPPFDAQVRYLYLKVGVIEIELGENEYLRLKELSPIYRLTKG